MHTFSETGSGVPAFLAKLWRLVEDTETNNLIYWSKDGRSFVIQNQAQFARDLLPLNYKHNNMASFIRQLNMYGFHKITSIDNGGLKFDRDEMEFSHPYFKRGCPYLLEHIKRKIANTKLQQNLDDKNGGGSGTIKSESVNKVLNEVKVMRTRQETLDSRFNVMKQENEALWREIATLRQKHIKQQQLVNKLIQFLVTIVQPSRNMSGVKRHFQLMINDAPHSSKMRKASESESGPIIHELTEELLDEVAEAAEDTDELFESSSPNMNIGGGGFESPNTERPQSNLSVSNQVYDHSNQSSGGSDEIGYNLNNTSPKTVYHISEISENIDGSGGGGDEINYIEENCLNTPMVKQEMARNKQLQQHLQQQQQQLKNEQKQQQQRLRRKRSETTNISSTHPSSSAATAAKTINAPHIKTENDLDPSIFLDINSPADGATNNTIEPALISPNSNSSQPIPSTSSVNIINDNGGVGGGRSSNGNFQQNIKQTVDKQLYSAGDFINTEMPSDIFDESGSFGTNIDLTKLGNISSSSSSIATNPAVNGLSDKTLAVTKYNNQKNLSNEDILRLNTLDDVTTHIDSCENDLDNIKDLLRGEGYSLDSNALVGNGNNLSSNRLYLSSPLDNDILAKLFSDADILNPYGISSSLPNENFQDNNKKGSELMTYQPYYSQDFSDILDMNNKTTDYDDETSKSQELPGSILNTPYREERE